MRAVTCAASLLRCSRDRYGVYRINRRNHGIKRGDRGSRRPCENRTTPVFLRQFSIRSPQGRGLHSGQIYPHKLLGRDDSGFHESTAERSDSGHSFRNFYRRFYSVFELSPNVFGKNGEISLFWYFFFFFLLFLLRKCLLEIFNHLRMGEIQIRITISR